MSAFEFYVRIEHPITSAQIGAPLMSVSSWTYTSRFDRAGSISFSYSASDPNAQHVLNTRIARAFALLDGVWTEVGAGIIDDISVTPSVGGQTTCTAQGLDLIRELSYRGVGELEIGKPNGVPHATALTVLSAYAPTLPGWTFTPAASPLNNFIYARYDGESLLGALIYLAEKTGTHFYRGAGRNLTFTSSFQNSGVRALGNMRSTGKTHCQIASISKRVDTHDLLTRIHPYGSGQGKARLTLAATNRTPPQYYVLNKDKNYIENVSASQAFGLRDFPAFDFKEITPISNTAANKQAAANMLFDSALMELRRRSALDVQETYELSIEGCSALLRPMQTIWTTYRDDAQGISIDEDLKILEATWTMTPAGISTTRLIVSNDDRWPESDASAAAERAVQGRVFQAHPQLGPNSYWENGVLYVGSDQANHVAEFPFVLGPEVATIDRVRFRFKVTQVLSFTSAAAIDTTTSNPSSKTSADPSTKTTADPNTKTTADPSTKTSADPNTKTTADPSTKTTADQNTKLTADQSTKVSADANTKTQTDDGGAHTELPISTDSNARTDGPSSMWGNRSEPSYTPFAGTDHDHQIEHSHSLAHFHDLTLPPHQHPMVHQHGIDHTHGIVHTHGIDHTHGIVHQHGIDHTHGIVHQHGMAHTHGIDHTHTVEPVVVTSYGVYRAPTSHTFTMDELEYSINGGAIVDGAWDPDGWAPLNLAIPVGDYYEIDLTDIVQDPLTFVPKQENNLVEIRRASGAGAVAINSSLGYSTKVGVATESAHGLSKGDQVTITGTAHHNGIWEVVEVQSSTTFFTNQTGDTNSGLGGSVLLNKSAMILCKLGVVDFIQAVAIVA